MNKLPILKALVSFMFYVSMIIMLFSVPFIVILSVMPERVPFKFTIKGLKQAATVDAELIIYIIAIVIGYAFFTYALYLFKRILDLFSKKTLFDNRTITYLDQCGKAVLVGYFICIGSEFLYKMVVGQEIEISLNFGPNGSIAVICLGLFFIVLSEVFQKAKKLKEENDLTV